MTKDSYRGLLIRHHQQVMKDLQAMVTAAGDCYRQVDREDPDDIELIAYTLTIYNEIRELTSRVESFRATWID